MHERGRPVALPATHQRDTPLLAADGELLINGRTLREIVAQAGRTPLYVYDSTAMAARVQALRAHLPTALRVHYAIKANPLPAVLRTMAALVDGFDVASRGEMQRALDAGMPARAISFAGPGKRDEELAAAIAAGVVIAVESPGEFARLAVLAASREVPGQVPVLLRLNPDFALRRAGMSMGGAASPFGMDVEQASALLAAGVPAGLDVLGVQIFAGSQNLDAQAIIACQSHTLELAARFDALLPGGLRYLNLGGGFGIPYFPGERPLDAAAVGAALQGRVAEYPALFARAEVVLELGRYLVGEAGCYVTRVVDVKSSRGRSYAVVDGGMHHHLANSGNFGQVLRKNYPVIVGNRLDESCDTRVTVVGPLCTPLDVVGDDLLLPPLAVGDYIIVLQSGAYGASASPQGFLGHPPPLEILV